MKNMRIQTSFMGKPHFKQTFQQFEVFGNKYINFFFFSKVFGQKNNFSSLKIVVEPGTFLPPDSSH